MKKLRIVPYAEILVIRSCLALILRNNDVVMFSDTMNDVVSV